MKLTPKEQFNLAAETVAQSYVADFPESATVDSHYTETGYSDLPKAVRDTGTWREFHDKVAARVKRLNN